MSIRNEKVTLSALAAEQSMLRNIFGFAWNPGSPDNSLPPATAVLTATVEHDDGTMRTVLVRPGTWYGGKRLMTRVWLTSPTAGIAVMETGDEPDDIVVPSPVPGVVLLPVEDVQTLAAGLASPQMLTFLRPPGARQLTIQSRAHPDVFGGGAAGTRTASFVLGGGGPNEEDVWVGWTYTNPGSTNNLAGVLRPVPVILAVWGGGSVDAPTPNLTRSMMEPSQPPPRVYVHAFSAQPGDVIQPGKSISIVARWS